MASEEQWDREVRELTNQLMQCEDDIERLRDALHLVLKDPRLTELSEEFQSVVRTLTREPA
jgi:hypothetical protein